MPYDTRNVAASSSTCISDGRHVRPRGCLIHTSSGVASLNWLQGGSCRAGSPAGADALIERDGTQYIITPANRYAYHAGNSRLYLEGELADNEISEALIGIELECLADQAPTYEQYDSLGLLIVQYGLMWSWRWPYIIYGHYAVARPQGRRADPVNFDWGSLMGRLYVHALAQKVAGLVEE